MVPNNQSSSPDDDDWRAPEPALSLSTGRLEGRAVSSGAPSKRHNPLRDEYPSRRDDPRPSSRAGNSGKRRRRPDVPFAPQSASQVEEPPLQDGTTDYQAAGRTARAKRKRGAHRPRADKRTIALGVVAAALAVVVIMAIAHVGPFAGRWGHADADKHIGAISAAAINNNGAQLVQTAYTQISLAAPVEPALDKLPAHAPTRADLEQLSGQKAPFAFTLNENGNSDTPAPVLSDQSLVALSNALTYYESNDREAGYLLLDMTTGRGIAGNLDALIYGASSFKGPFCAYVVQREMPNDISNAASSRTTQIENVITYSDNASYGQLRRDFGNEGIKAWLSEAGVNEALAEDTYFPTYTARQSALMWLKIYDYLETADTSAAEWLSGVFEQTEVSFLRNGALGTHSIGQTDYRPEEGSEVAEEYAADEAADSADNTEASGAAEGSDEGNGGQFAIALSSSASSDEANDEGRTLSAPADSGDSSESTPESSDTADDADGTEGETEAEPAVASLGNSITVRNKAGWIAGEEDDSICDSGIVTINGHNYLMVIMTSVADSAEGEQAFSHLARTLFEVRADLV